MYKKAKICSPAIIGFLVISAQATMDIACRVKTKRQKKKDSERSLVAYNDLG